MAGINNVHLSGYIVRGPYRLAVPGNPDKTIVEFMVGVPESENRDYILCFVYGALADESFPIIKPGTWVYIQGSIASTPHESQIERNPTLVLKVKSIDIPYPRPSKSVENSHESHGQQTSEQPSVSTPTEFTDDDIPWK